MSTEAGKTEEKTTTTGADPAAQLAAAEAKIKELEGRLAAPAKKDDPSLLDAARKEREGAENDASKVKRLEGALTFTMKAGDFYKTNESLLPKEVEGIFAAAEKEKYNNAIEKSDSIKAGIVQSFFSVQGNVDLLTSSQKLQLDEYLALTKTGKQEKASDFYDRIFEPTFENLKRVKRAESLQKGHGDGGDDAYKKKLIAGTEKHYLGAKR